MDGGISQELMDGHRSLIDPRGEDELHAISLHNRAKMGLDLLIGGSEKS